MIPVIFIAGAGASGSTFLDTILGNDPRIGSYGELAQLPEAGWLLDGVCGCGERVASCPFWREVRRTWLAPRGGAGLEDYVALQRRFIRIARRDRWSVELGRVSTAFRDYLDQTACLLEAIRRVDGVSWIVDSSKRASRALVLWRTPGVDLYVVHLVRDSRGVVWSLKRRARDGPKTTGGRPSTSSAAAFWIRRNLVADLLRWRLPRGRSVRVRYEDLVRDPQAVLAEIGRLTGLDLRDLAREVAAGSEMKVGHTFPGDRLLERKGPFRLNPDQEWVERMSRSDRSLCWALTGWLMKAHGYRRQPGGVKPDRAEGGPASMAREDRSS